MYKPLVHDSFVKNEENEQKLRNVADVYLPPGNQRYYFIAKRSVNFANDLFLKQNIFSASTSETLNSTIIYNFLNNMVKLYAQIWVPLHHSMRQRNICHERLIFIMVSVRWFK